MNYKNLYDVQLEDLKSLCRKCHKEIHCELKEQNKKKHKKKYNKNIFKHSENLIERVSKIANVDRSIVEFHLNKLKNDIYTRENKKNTTK